MRLKRGWKKAGKEKRYGEVKMRVKKEGKDERQRGNKREGGRAA